MADRTTLRLRFLEKTPYANWSVEPLVADASARSYFRLRSQDQTCILADVPPETEDYGKFLRIAEILNEAGMNAPKCLNSDTSLGFFVISDLGASVLNKHLLKVPTDTPLIFDGLIDLLFHLRQVIVRDLPCLNPDSAGEMLSPLFEDFGGRNQKVVQAAMTSVFEENVSRNLCLSLRDFHSENLIWDPSKIGIKRFGLLDFQDAFLAPNGYDLASFTRDVRRNMSVSDQHLLEGKLADTCGFDRSDFHLQIAILAIQRNLRILGVFAKLIANGKTQYQDFLPQTWQYIVQDLEHPDLSGLASVIRNNIPPPRGV